MRYRPSGGGGGGTAETTTFTPYGQLASSDVQSALEEVNDMIDFNPAGTGWLPPLFDDFTNGVNSGEPYGRMGWDSVSNGTGGGNVQTSPSTSEKHHIGVWRMTCGTGVGNYGGIVANQSLLFGDSTLIFATRFKIGTLADATDDYSLRLGFSNTYPTIQHGACFEYLRTSSVNWRLITSAASVATTTTTGTAVDTNWHVARLVVTNASSVAFYLDGTLLGTHTTNIPTSSGQVCGPFMVMSKTAGTLNRAWDVDWTYFRARVGSTRGTW